MKFRICPADRFVSDIFSCPSEYIKLTAAPAEFWKSGNRVGIPDGLWRGQRPCMIDGRAFGIWAGRIYVDIKGTIDPEFR